jgi:hypothetical protein
LNMEGGIGNCIVTGTPEYTVQLGTFYLRLGRICEAF